MEDPIGVTSIKNFGKGLDMEVTVSTVQTTLTDQIVIDVKSITIKQLTEDVWHVIVTPQVIFCCSTSCSTTNINNILSLSLSSLQDQ